MGGLRMLDALGYEISVYHMNEGHAALLTLALLEKTLSGGALSSAQERDLDAVRQHCVFTTHTPVPAGHDRFSIEQAQRILGSERDAARWSASAAARRHAQHDATSRCASRAS